MLEEIINKVLEQHNDFTYDEIKEVCDDFLSCISAKIKETTKLKRLSKYIDKEFELENNNDIEIFIDSNKIYNLETIPKYLFTWKSHLSTNLLNITKLTKSIGTTDLFKNTNLKINSDDKIALIWKNWCWKTTLLKMIIWKNKLYFEKDIDALDLENLDWTIDIVSNLKIWYLSQDLFWKSKDNTLRQEMLEIFPEITKNINKLNEIKNKPDKWEETVELNKILLKEDWFKKYSLQLEILKYFWFSNEQMDFNVLQLSWWEQTKVQIAKFLIQKVDLLILDEPTNHLDINWIVFLEQFCKNWKKSILSISHDVRFIDNTSNKIAEISDKKIHYYSWNYKTYLEEKQAKFDKQLKDFNTQQKELEIKNAYISRFRANSAKASSVQSRIKAIDKLDILEKPTNESTVKTIKISVNKRLPEIIMKLKNIEVWYTYPIITLPEYLEVYKNDKIWIIWKNWAGKTTLLKTILWELDVLDWIVEINENICI